MIVNARIKNNPYLAGIVVSAPCECDSTGRVWVRFPHLRRSQGPFHYDKADVQPFITQANGLIQTPTLKHVRQKWLKKALKYEEKLHNLIGHL